MNRRSWALAIGLVATGMVAGGGSGSACFRLVTVPCCGQLQINDYCIPGDCPAGTPCCRVFISNPVVHAGSSVLPGGSGKTNLGNETNPVWCEYQDPICVLPNHICTLSNQISSGFFPHTLIGDDCSTPVDPCPPTTGCDE